MTPGGLGAVAAMDAPQFEGLRKVDGLRKVAAMDAPQFEGCLPAGRQEAGWRHAYN